MSDQYEVTVMVRVMKTYRVEAMDRDDAAYLAMDMFSLGDDDAIDVECRDCDIFDIKKHKGAA